MRYKTFALVFFAFFNIAAAGICSSHSVIPFSGYKVTRRHKVRIRPLKSDSFLVLTKCHRGIPLFSRTVRSLSVRDEFSTPFCDSHTEFDFSKAAHKKNHKSFFPSSSTWSENHSEITSGVLKNKASHSVQVRDTKLKGWFGSFIENLMESSAVNPQADMVAAFDIKTEANSESFPIFKKKVVRSSKPEKGPAPCMKLARRKRYARSNIVIFIPATFVGALFMCSDVEEQSYANVEFATASIVKKHDEESMTNWPKFKKSQKKRRALNWVDESDESPSRKGGVFYRPSLKDMRTMKIKRSPASAFPRQPDDLPFPDSENFDFEHDPFHFEGSAVCPLVADDYSSHWISVQFSPPAIIYHVPYLRSPSIWDPRFKSSLSHGSANWDQDIDINEAYSYTRKELNRIGEALMHSRKYITHLFFMKRTRLSSILALRKRWIQKFDPRLQLSIILSSFGKSATLKHVIRLQRIWDKLPHNDAPMAISG